MTHKKPSPVTRTLGIITILVALYIVLFGGVPVVNNETAERTMSEIAAHFAAEAAARGNEAKLQYSGLEIRGIAYDKWARVSGLALDVFYQHWQEHSRLGFSTGMANLIPDHTNAERAVLRFGDAVNILLGSDLLAVITPDKPLYYAVNFKPAEKDSVHHRLVIPASLGMRMIAPRREMRIELTKPLVGDLTFYTSQHRVQSHLAAPFLRLVSPDGTWNAQNTDLRYESTQPTPLESQSKGTASIDALSFVNSQASTPGYLATAAWTMKENRTINGSVDAMSLSIERGLFAGGDVKISLEGDLHFDIDDAAYGELILEMGHPEDFIKSGWIKADKQELAESLLDDIMGQDMRGRKQAIINIVRKKNGEWMIGKAPLSALLDKGLLSIFIFSTEERHD